MNHCNDRTQTGMARGSELYTCARANDFLKFRNDFEGTVCQRCEAGNLRAPLEAAAAALRHAIRDARHADHYKSVYNGDRLAVVGRALAAGIEGDDVCLQLTEAVGNGLDSSEAMLIANHYGLLTEKGE